MARTTGPLLSLDASGSIAGAMTFSKWKGRSYVRQLVTPHNPDTPMQRAMRAMFKFLGSQWSNINPTDQDTWNGLADGDKIADFNAYMKINQAAWKHFQTPSMAYPAIKAGTPATITSQSVTPGIGQATVNIDINAVNQNWGFIIYRSLTTGFTPSMSDVIAIMWNASTTVQRYVDSPLAADTYYYVVQPFTTDGVIGSLGAEMSAVVT